MTEEGMIVTISVILPLDLVIVRLETTEPDAVMDTLTVGPGTTVENPVGNDCGIVIKGVPVGVSTGSLV